MGLKISKEMVKGLTEYRDEGVKLYITKDSWGMDSWQIYDPELKVPKEILESNYEKRVLWSKPMSSLYITTIHLYVPAKVKKMKSDKDIIALVSKRFVSLVRGAMYNSLISLLKQMFPTAKLTPYIYPSNQTYTHPGEHKPVIIRANHKVVCVFTGITLNHNQ